ncbi:MAG: diguanylate cyclase [Thermodesulfobacteriota bacterium]
MKILLADDSPTTLFALKKSLEEWGYEVLEFNDGAEAWRALNAEDPPRIAILDWMMPEMDGIEVCKKLQARTGSPFVYTILLTSKSEKEDLVLGLESGAHNFQSKPISPEELRSHVNVGRRLVEADDKLKEYATEMEVLAQTDVLTGIYNRRYLMEQGGYLFKSAKRTKRPLSLMILDIDHFKKVNDTFGHAAGDEVLKKMAASAHSKLRDIDIFGRIGGEEFAVVMPEADLEGAIKSANRLCGSLSELEVKVDNDTIRFTVSIGVTSLEEKDESLEDLLKRSDEYLYAAKEGGRNRVVSTG